MPAFISLVVMFVCLFVSLFVCLCACFITSCFLVLVRRFCCLLLCFFVCALGRGFVCSQGIVWLGGLFVKFVCCCSVFCCLSAFVDFHVCVCSC